MPDTTISGISTASDGTAYIPASKRADGTTRKALRVRPGFTPQEDVQTYRSRNAETWKNRGSGGVPGADEVNTSAEVVDNKGRNAKRREAAKRRQANPSAGGEDALVKEANGVRKALALPVDTTNSGAGVDIDGNDAVEAERQKKIRNLLKRLVAVKDLKSKKIAGEKLSPDQLMKLGREQEIVRELKKLHYDEDDSVETVPPPVTDDG